MPIVYAVVGGLVVLAGVFVVGMRMQWAPVTTAVRRMNKRFMNPRQMRTAGQPGAYAGIVRHVGRSSGAAYETPVGIEETPDGFVVALPYGTTADWLKNVLAAGSAELVRDGATHGVDRPRVVGPDEALEYFPEGEQRTFRTMHVDEFLLLRRVEAQG
ncbi:MAG: nitroreductase family deazaflavin-dependent oxidoreductase [Acidimicrobiia bacterium]